MGVILRPLDDPHNKIVKAAERLGSSREARERSGQALLEGPRAVAEALRHAVRLRTVLYSARLLDRPDGRELLDRAAWARARMVYVTDRVLDVVTQVETHQGIAAVVAHGVPSVAAVEGPRVLVLDAVQDPANLGALIRSAVAFGFRVAVTRGSVDPFNPKALRASAGLLFRAGLVWLEPGWEAWPGVQLVVTSAHGGLDYSEWDWTRPTALVLGNEGAGVSAGLAARAVAMLRIPITDDAESLNVAAAGAIIMADAHRRGSAGH